jgi:hypothetical protein
MVKTALFQDMNKKIFIYSGIGLFILGGMAATPPLHERPDWKHLEVIPKHTDEDQMERIMHQYSKALSVTCSYCHPDTKPGIFPRRVDFASEEKPAKQAARKMMRMTDRINRKYFDSKNNYDVVSFQKQVVTCKTCHRGLVKPRNIPLN